MKIYYILFLNNKLNKKREVIVMTFVIDQYLARVILSLVVCSILLFQQGDHLIKKEIFCYKSFMPPSWLWSCKCAIFI